MNGQKRGGIVELLLKITVILAALKLLGILPIRWVTVFAPIRLAIIIVILVLLVIWILSYWGRR